MLNTLKLLPLSFSGPITIFTEGKVKLRERSRLYIPMYVWIWIQESAGNGQIRNSKLLVMGITLCLSGRNTSLMFCDQFPFHLKVARQWLYFLSNAVMKLRFLWFILFCPTTAMKESWLKIVVFSRIDHPEKTVTKESHLWEGQYHKGEGCCKSKTDQSLGWREIMLLILSLRKFFS